MFTEEWSSDTHDPRADYVSVAEWFDEMLRNVPDGTVVRVRAVRDADDVTFELHVEKDA